MSRAETRINPHGRPALWFGMLGGPVIWFLQLLVNWSLTEGICSPSFTGFLGVGTIRLVVLLGGLVAATIAIAAGVVSYRSWQQMSMSNDTAQNNEGAGPRQFMALGGTFLSAFFALAIVFTTVPVFILPCE
jgi:hypothetical protein